jgi:hypothetical protein
MNSQLHSLGLGHALAMACDVDPRRTDSASLQLLVLRAQYKGCNEIIVTKFGKGSAGARVERHAGSLVMENILNAAGVLEDREFQAALRLHSAGMSKRC